MEEHTVNDDFEHYIAYSNLCDISAEERDLRFHAYKAAWEPCTDNKDKLIVTQALKIEEAEIALKSYKASHRSIYNIIYCIGGPLNDNILMFNKKQMCVFAEIASFLD